MSVEGVRGNLEISDLERREEAMYLPALGSKEELSQELFSWERGLKEIKFFPSLRPDGPQTHLFFNVCHFGHKHVNTKQDLVQFLWPKSRRTGMAEAVLET